MIIVIDSLHVEQLREDVLLSDQLQTWIFSMSRFPFNNQIYNYILKFISVYNVEILLRQSEVGRRVVSTPPSECQFVTAAVSTS
jgi:hypothetical protein